MARVRVGVLRGGPSSEYAVSLETGKGVLSHLPGHYEAHDILITKDGTWHWRGLPIKPALAAKQFDVFFNALHGEYGEDGKIQNLLDQLATPYTGSGTVASALAMNKVMAKEVFRRLGLKVAPGLALRHGESEEPARQIFEKIAPPWIVKPVDRGSSVGLALARSYKELTKSLTEAFAVSPNVLVEKYIPGREATCGVVDNFRDQGRYALPAIEIRRPAGRSIWNYQDKYSGETQEICPGQFRPEDKAAIEAMAIQAHDALGLRHYSRSDFIISPRGIYILETNTLPGLTPTSLLPKALEAVGCSYADFLDHLIKQALIK